MLFNNMLMASGALAAATTELAPTNAADTDFGRITAFSGDDSRLFVTSRQSVHVYTMSGATPTFEARIVPGDGLTYVNVSADSTGTRAAFGSNSDKEVYIYARSGTTWSLEATLTDPNSSGDGSLVPPPRCHQTRPSSLFPALLTAQKYLRAAERHGRTARRSQTPASLG